MRCRVASALGVRPVDCCCSMGAPKKMNVFTYFECSVVVLVCQVKIGYRVGVRFLRTDVPKACPSLSTSRLLSPCREGQHEAMEVLLQHLKEHLLVEPI